MYKFLFTMLATLCFAICCSGCAENYNNQNTIKIKNKSLDRFLMYQYKLDVPDTDELDIDKFIELDLYIDKSTDCEYLVSSNSEMVQLVTAEGTPQAEKYKEKLIVGGHSKGGNLAVYSAVFCKDSVKNRIERVINADGPGFDKSVILTDNYKKILNKIQTYIPQSSIVGRLLEHEEEYQVVKSIQKGVMQHDIYSWEIEPTKLIRIPTVTNNSEIFNDIVSDWLKNTTPEQRENFINIIYEIILETQAQKTSDFRVETAKKIGIILNGYININPEDKKEIEHMVKLILESAFKVLKENRNANKLMEKEKKQKNK